MNAFENFGLDVPTVTTIQRLGITVPTEIQRKSIPHIIAGKDVIGESATGSGKTLAFGCGIIEYVERNKGLQALILTPTRELAEQVKESLKQLSSQKRLNVIPIYGGVSIGPQIRDLSKADVVVGTPGRLLDHVQRRTINTSKIKLLVIDEADRMFDMGFIEDMERIVKLCPKERQTLFFSATISSRVKSLANKYMIQPIEVSAENQVDPSRLKQVYYDVSRGMKLSLLVHLLKKEDYNLVMIFCNTRRNTDFVAMNLRANGIRSVTLHGGYTQNKRMNTIKMFNEGKSDILICTDVAARGLHIENVSHIYNYDLPKDPKDYVHRIGRTARVEEEGEVINLLCNLDHDNFSKILREYTSFNIEKFKKPYIEKIVTRQDKVKQNTFFRKGKFRRRNNFR